MTSATRRDALVVIGLVLAAASALLLLLARPARGQGNEQQRGKELFAVGCSSCHGQAGGGVTTPDGQLRGPSLTASGEAGAFYELSTGRMPLANSNDEPRRKRAVYNTEEIASLVAYVGSLGNGPKLPNVDVSNTNVAHGGELFRANCAPCHSASGAGGALSYGRAAPSLGAAQPQEIGAAVRSGPSQMPVFGPDALSSSELNDVVAYVGYLRAPEDPGGLPIGRIGPVPEGFVAWFFGAGALLAIVAWIGTRAPARNLKGGSE
ncbi:MAG: ubiquinol-cytochrome c reductase cytochrome c subunit [Acidimicrobiaceae bacterium]|jgi:ubiquinol-cytochrome c reductase cytochrome c subunit